MARLVRRGSDDPSDLCWNPSAAPAFLDTESLEGVDAFIHLCGANLAAKRWTEAYRREITDSRVSSTRALAEALARLQRPPRALLVASAVGIYGERGNELLDESSLPGAGFLANLCQNWEAATRPAAEAGIRVVHLRFGVVITPGAGALRRIEPIFRLGLGGRLGSGQQWMSWIALDDLLEAVKFLLDTPTISGAVNVTSPAPVTNADFTRALAQYLGRPAVLPAPAFALRLALGPMADEALLASARVVPRKLLDAGFAFAFPRIEDALQSPKSP